MEHLLNWVEIPVMNMKRAISFYRELLKVDFKDTEGNKIGLHSTN